MGKTEIFVLIITILATCMYMAKIDWYYWRVGYADRWRVTNASDSQHSSPLSHAHCFWALFHGAGGSLSDSRLRTMYAEQQPELVRLYLELHHCPEAYRQPRRF